MEEFGAANSNDRRGVANELQMVTRGELFWLVYCGGVWVPAFGSRFAGRQPEGVGGVLVEGMVFWEQRTVGDRG